MTRRGIGLLITLALGFLVMPLVTAHYETIGGSMNSQWASVDEQLQAAKVTRGSALEKLIRDNQEIHLLDPREANDDADLPAWLRVYWRKNHPDVQHSTVNPGAGYPDVLYTIYAWMLSHHDLPWGTPTDPTRSKGGNP